jgi:hypothetical protein
MGESTPSPLHHSLLVSLPVNLTWRGHGGVTRTLVFPDIAPLDFDTNHDDRSRSHLQLWLFLPVPCRRLPVPRMSFLCPIAITTHRWLTGEPLLSPEINHSSCQVLMSDRLELILLF